MFLFSRNRKANKMYRVKFLKKEQYISILFVLGGGGVEEHQESSG